MPVDKRRLLMRNSGWRMITDLLAATFNYLGRWLQTDESTLRLLEAMPTSNYQIQRWP
jgi:hypothetical protein